MKLHFALSDGHTTPLLHFAAYQRASASHGTADCHGARFAISICDEAASCDDGTRYRDAKPRLSFVALHDSEDTWRDGMS